MLEKLVEKFTFCPFPKKFVSFKPKLMDAAVELEYPAPNEASPVFFSSTSISKSNLSGKDVRTSFTSTLEKKFSALIESRE